MPTYNYSGSGGLVAGGLCTPVKAVAPMGIYSGPISSLANLIANSPNFQLFTNTTSASQAYNFIYLSNILQDELQRPICEILVPEGFTTEISGGAFVRNITLWVAFESAIDPDFIDDHYNASLSFLNIIGAIHVDVMNASYSDLMIQSIATSSPLQRSAITEEPGTAPYMRISWTVLAGLNV